MHVLGEPVGRHLVAEPALLRLAIDDGAGGRELIAEPDIVDEASHLCSRGAALDPAGDELRQGRKPLEIDLLGELPAAAFLFPRSSRSAATWMGAGSFQWMITRSATLIAATSISGRLMELMHPRFDPTREEDVIDGIGGAHHDVGP